MLNPFQGMALPRRVITRVQDRAQRLRAKQNGAAERISAAQAKQDRKNAKRAEIARRNAS